MENLMIDGTTCTPKLNYAFANQVKKELPGLTGWPVQALLDQLEKEWIVKA